MIFTLTNEKLKNNLFDLQNHLLGPELAILGDFELDSGANLTSTTRAKIG